MAFNSSKTGENNNTTMMQQFENYIIVDVGANLTNKKFSRDLDSVLQRAKDSGKFYDGLCRNPFINVPYFTSSMYTYSYLIYIFAFHVIQIKVSVNAAYLVVLLTHHCSLLL